MSASFEEKSVWITLVTLLITSALYSIGAAMMKSSGVSLLIAYVPLFAAAVVLLVIIVAAAHIAVAIASRPDGRDERDQLIEWRAESNSGWVLGVGVLAAICGLIVSLDNFWIAHLLLLSLFASEVFRCVLQLVYYRRGL